MTTPKQISIILPSFRDARIVEAIASVRAFDDCASVRIIIVDGSSPPELVETIAGALTPDDVLISEPDDGIFDALNKGLRLVDTPYLGWIGSDDLFSGEVRASEVIERLANSDLFIASLAFIKGDYVQRVNHSWPAAAGLVSIGLHNPHYATFGRSELLKAEKFDPGNVAADIDYFLRIFAREPRIVHTSAIGTLQGEGGFSNSSLRKIFKVNRLVFRAYRNRRNVAAALLGVVLKLSYKFLGRAYFSIRRIHWPTRFPVANEARALAHSRSGVKP